MRITTHMHLDFSDRHESECDAYGSEVNQVLVRCHFDDDKLRRELQKLQKILTMFAPGSKEPRPSWLLEIDPVL